MDVCVAIDHRFQRTPDGNVWSGTTFTEAFWQRYLDVYERVRVVARVNDVDHPQDNWGLASGPGIGFEPVPHYHGPKEYLQRMGAVRRTVYAAMRPEDAVILRVQGQIASCARPHLRRTGHPYGVEVVGDPYDAFAPGYVTHPLRPLLRVWLPQRMREQCAGACAAAYVTEHTLQERYPPAPDAFATHYSSIVLPPEALATRPRPAGTFGPKILIFVGTLDNLSKGPDTLIEALSLAVDGGADVCLRIVGGGRYQAQLAAQAIEQGVGDRVHFLGWVAAGQGVRDELDQADLFVLPSRQEGLSRSTIEAMARGLPCIATTIGGTAELLLGEDMVVPNDPVGLAAKISAVVSDPERLSQMARRNLARAGEYEESCLRRRWTAMYRHLRQQTEVWQRTHHG
jgi:glycosyltransferase involved in cell wall biosynthesis